VEEKKEEKKEVGSVIKPKVEEKKETGTVIKEKKEEKKEEKKKEPEGPVVHLESLAKKESTLQHVVKDRPQQAGKRPPTRKR
jgi:hypothetical protein